MFCIPMQKNQNIFKKMGFVLSGSKPWVMRCLLWNRIILGNSWSPWSRRKCSKTNGYTWWNMKPMGQKSSNLDLWWRDLIRRKILTLKRFLPQLWKLPSIWTILSIVVVKDVQLEKLDVKNKFLHGHLEGEIYMQQPEEFEVKGNENLMCRLTRYL